MATVGSSQQPKCNTTDHSTKPYPRRQPQCAKHANCRPRHPTPPIVIPLPIAAHPNSRCQIRPQHNATQYDRMQQNATKTRARPRARTRARQRRSVLPSFPHTTTSAPTIPTHNHVIAHHSRTQPRHSREGGNPSPLAVIPIHRTKPSPTPHLTFAAHSKYPIPMNVIKIIAYIAFAAAVPLFLVSTNVRILVNAPLLYSYGFDQYDIVSATGIPRSDLLSVGAQIRDYFNNDQDRLDVPFYNEREILHMVDVKGIVQAVYAVQTASGLFLLFFIPTGLALAPRKFPRTLWKLLGWGGAATLGIVFLAGVFSLTGFSQTFYTFHLIAFSNDLWQLDPARDFLLKMFPEGFFFDATMVLVIAAVVQALWLLYASGLALKAFTASSLFKASVVQGLSALAAAVFVLRVFPDGFFFEAVMIFAAATVVQALAVLAAGAFARNEAGRAAPAPDGGARAQRSAADVRRPPKRAPSDPREPERVGHLADLTVIGYYAAEGALLASAYWARLLLNRRRPAATSSNESA